MSEKITFSFGRNWADFLKKISPNKLEIAKQSVQDFFGSQDFSGKTVIDIGSGSGIFSYSMYEMNADKITSIDVDPFSVECTEHMRKKAKEPINWGVIHGSILDQTLIKELGSFDVVYSWGVLHHTGDMWSAIHNAASLVAPQGQFYIAIYNHVTGILGSKFWLKIKKIYNRFPLIGKYIMEPYYMVSFCVTSMLKFRNPFRIIREYHNKRGMNWRRDITDWFGGYPYEYANIEEVFSYMKENFPDFQLENVKSTNGLGNNWFLYKNKK